MENIVLNEGERLDDLHRKNYKIIQDTSSFCFGMDAVLLSDFAKCKKDDNVLDIGTGTGIIPILMCGKDKIANYTALEVNSHSAEIAKRNVALNGLDNRIKVVNDNILNIDHLFPQGYFNVVVTNPPYMQSGVGLQNIHESKSIARHEILCTLEDIMSCTTKVLKYGGKFYMVHRANRLVDIFYYMRKHCIEPKVIRLIQSHQNKEPNLVLVEGIKGGKPMLKVLSPLVIYNNDDTYTEELNRIYYGDEN